MALQFQTRPQREKPTRLFVHGVEKIGKSSFAAFAPNPVFLMSKGEDGLEVLISKGQLPETPYLPVCQTWEDLVDNCWTLAREKHDRKTAVLDVCRGFERMLEEFVIADRFRGSAHDFHDFARGRKFSVPAWKEFLNGPLDALVQRGMSVVILAHSKTKPVKTPMGEDLLNYYPDSEECYWDETKKWVDQILHLTRLGLVDRDALQRAKKFGDSAKYKNVEVAEQRVVCTDQSIFYVAGGRLGLPDQIPLPTVARPAYPWEGAEKGWAALQGAMKTSRQQCLKAAEQWAAARAPKADAEGKAEGGQPASPPPAVQAPAPPASPPAAASPPPPPATDPYAVTRATGPEPDELDGTDAAGDVHPGGGKQQVGRQLAEEVLSLSHALGLTWNDVRDEFAEQLGITSAPVFEQDAAAMLSLRTVLKQRVEEKEKRGRKKPAGEPAGAGAEG